MNSLKEKFQGELRHPGTGLVGDYAEASHVGHVDTRQGPSGMVRCVECLSTKLERRALGCFETLEDRGVEVVLRWGAEIRRCSRRIAEGEVRRLGEHRRIEVPLHGGILH